MHSTTEIRNDVSEQVCVKLELHITAPAKDRDVGSLVPVGQTWKNKVYIILDILYGIFFRVAWKSPTNSGYSWTLDSADVMVSKRCWGGPIGWTIQTYLSPLAGYRHVTSVIFCRTAHMQQHKDDDFWKMIINSSICRSFKREAKRGLLAISKPSVGCCWSLGRHACPRRGCHCRSSWARPPWLRVCRQNFPPKEIKHPLVAVP